ncbi:MAG: DNA adenine methylase [Treponema sp.]|jgi:adenine-specific DNA-methyltransferase|nr:DNA adenine methylase [Treponema sp.]
MDSLAPGVLADRDALPEAALEDEAFLSQQIVTYIGNKRALLGFIGEAVGKVQKRLGRKKLDMFDVFSGSGIVARYFKQHARLVIANDLEGYSDLLNRCYLSNRDELDLAALGAYYQELAARLGEGSLEKGLIAERYAPEDDANIRAGERVFYTARNARYIDTARRLIGELPEDARKYFLGPLLSEASVHANTSGVFKGFYKNRETGIGQFGGKNRDALCRITGNISLPFPVFSNFNTGILVSRGDANSVIHSLPETDIAYLDPPYNQHPYGSNYFMLNLILDYRPPRSDSKISGIPKNWNRSPYNSRERARAALAGLVEGIKAKYVLISYNSEGFIGPGEMASMLKGIGKFEILETRYNAFRGSRNLGGRGIYVREYLYLLEK